MTKLKSKKMSKSTFAIIIMAIAMVAMLAFGGTYAYFTANALGFATGDVKTGIVEITSVRSGETIAASAKVVSGSYVLGDAADGENTNNYKVDLTSKSNVDTYVFATFTASVDGDELFINAGTDEEPNYITLLDVTGLPTGGTNGSTWTLVTGQTGVYYLNVAAVTEQEVATGKILPAFECKVQIREALKANRTQVEGDDPNNGDETVTSYVTYSHNVYTRTGTDGNYTYTEYGDDIMDQEVVVTLTFKSIQQEGFVETGEGPTLKTAVENAYAALN